MTKLRSAIVDAAFVVVVLVSLAFIWKFLPEALRPSTPTIASTILPNSPIDKPVAARIGVASETVANPPSTEQVIPPHIPEVALDESDFIFERRLAELMGTTALSRFFVTEKMVRKFVATVDNLPRQTTPMQVMPVKPTAGQFMVDRNPTAITISPSNTTRYVGFIDAASSVDLKSLVALYVQHYALFQQAYHELGYPKLNFNDRLLTAIDDLLAAEDLPTPMEVVQPKVIYEFADPDIESKSAGQKIMTRIGRSNAQRVRKMLKALRAELEHNHPGVSQSSLGTR